MDLSLKLHSRGLTAALAAAALSMTAPIALAQATATTQQVPSAPTQQAIPAAPGAGAPAARPAVPPGPPKFPTPDPKNFTASQPSPETVDSFLHASWGYDPNRVWKVEAIENTQAAGISKVVVYVATMQNPQQIAPLVFFVTPDGQHLIASDVLPFGAHPFAQNRQTLETQATGPSKGGASKQLELVEFSDFQCPHCKAAQPTITQLLTDFPTAHFVYENYPLESVHPQAFQAAAYGVCVAKLSGNDAFFKFADTVFGNQANLTDSGAVQTLTDAATKAGADAAKVTACAATPETKAAVDASVKLAKDLNVNETPTLFINGRPLPVNAVPYDVLKTIVNYDMQQAAAAK